LTITLRNVYTLTQEVEYDRYTVRLRKFYYEGDTMSVENALKMLKDEKIALEREAVKIERAIKALESSGITRSRASTNGGQVKPKADTKPAVREQNKEANLKAILEYIHHNPGKTVDEITEALNMSSRGYTYTRVRELAELQAIKSEGFPRQWFGVE